MTNMKVWSGFMLLLLSCLVLLLSEERGMQQNEGERKDPSLPQTTSGFAGKISGLETRVNSLRTVLNNVNEDNQPLRVYDSTDKLVRTISGTNGNVAVVSFAFTFQGLLFNLQFGKTQAAGTTSGPYFLSRDCTGPAFIDQDVTHIFPDTALVGNTV